MSNSIKVGGNTDIDVYPENVEDYKTGKKTGGVQLEISGKLFVQYRNYPIQDTPVVKIWLSREECKLLKREITKNM